MKALLIFLVRLYRCVLSPVKMFVFGPHAHCRFTPTCSEYALDAVQLHGAVKGAVLSVGRICRCHPWGGCGPDPVPRELRIANYELRAAADPESRQAIPELLRPHA